MNRLVSLLAAVTAVALFATPGFAQTSYTWEIDCSPNPFPPGVGTGVDWYWLHNGVQISISESPPNGFASCASNPPLFGGSEPIPTSINGIEVNGIQATLAITDGLCEAFGTVTKSFSPSSPKISISDTVSVPATVRSFAGAKERCPNQNASFSFSLQTR
jgi:hypothetical protein